jgi:hypothetical protein
LRAYQRRTLAADALIASNYLAGTNTRRVRRALKALFGGAVGKDTVSRVWRKVKADWDSWNARSLADEPIVRLILNGTVVDVRLDRKATAISLLVVIGVRADGQKVLLAVKSMGGESAEAWRSVLDDLIARGLRRPELLIVDGGQGLEKAIAAVWDGMPVQRCTVGSLKKWSVPLVYAAMRPVALASSPARGCDLGNGLPGRDPAQQKRKESGRQPLEVDCSGGQINLDLHIGEATPDGAREPMPRLGFAMKAL